MASRADARVECGAAAQQGREGRLVQAVRGGEGGCMLAMVALELRRRLDLRVMKVIKVM